ncbi:O-antigen ligase [Sphingomonas sp. HH69]
MYMTLLVVNLLIYIVVLAWYARQPCASAFHPATFYAAVHGFVFVIRPIFAWIGQYQSIYILYRFMPTMNEKMTVITIAILAYVVVMATLVKLAPQRMIFVSVPDDIRDRMKAPVLIASATLGMIALYSILRNVNAAAEGITTMKVTANGYKINTSGNGYLSDAQQMLVPITLMIAWAYRFRFLSLVPFLLFVVLKSSGGGRGPFMIAAATMALLYLYENKRSWPTPRILGLAVVLLMLFVSIGQDRGYAIRSLFFDEPPRVVNLKSKEHDFFDGMDFANMEYVEFLVHTVPKRTGTYNYFADNLQVFTEPVPRVLWPGKPVGPPIQFYNLWDYGNPWGLTISVVGQGWQGLGWLGVVIYAFLTGAFLAAIYRFAVRRIVSPFVLIGYLTFLGGTILYLRDGALLTVLRSELFYLAPVIMSYAIAPDVRLRLNLFRRIGAKSYATALEQARKLARTPNRNIARGGRRQAVSHSK